MHKIPTWVIICLTALALPGGLALISIFEPQEFSQESSEITNAPLWLFLAVGIPVYVLEALVWTVAFTELGARLFKSAEFGAFLGVIFYGLFFHWSGGWFSILVSTWICLVLNTSYLLIRKRSRVIAIVSTIAHKFVFILYAAWTLSAPSA